MPASALSVMATASSAPLEVPTQTGTADSGQFPSLAELEKQHILAALRECNGNRTHAAKMLDISIRTLRNKLNEYNGATKPEADPQTVTEG